MCCVRTASPSETPSPCTFSQTVGPPHHNSFPMKIFKAVQNRFKPIQTRQKRPRGCNIHSSDSVPQWFYHFAFKFVSIREIRVTSGSSLIHEIREIRG